MNSSPHSPPLRLVVPLLLLALVLAVVPSLQAAPSATIVVKPSSMNGWVNAIETGSPSMSFVSGPGTPPLGSGSQRTVLTASGDGGGPGTANYAGIRFDQFTALTYSTYRAAPATGAQAPAFQFNVDYDLTDGTAATWQGRFVYEPYRDSNNTVTTGIWQSWDALVSSARWWGTGTPRVSDGVAAQQCPQSSPCTIAQALAFYPDMGIQATTLAGIIVKSGSGWASFDGNLDNLHFATNTGVDDTIDFEPETACTTTCYVDATTGDDSYGGDTPTSAKKTIQAAVNAVSAGGTVIVAAGSYAENVVIPKSLTLDGAGPTTILDGTTLGTDPGIRINSGVTDVTIQELRVQNHSVSGSLAGIYFANGNDGLVVQDVEIADTTGGRAGLYINGPVDDVLVDSVTATNNVGRGIVIWNGYKSNITITDNTVSGSNCCGIELQDGTASGVTLTGNNITVNNGDSALAAVGLMAGAGPNLIANNTVVTRGRFGIEIKLPNGTGLDSGDGSIVVENNDVSFSGTLVDLRDLAGISVYRRSYAVSNGNADIPTGVIVRDNTVTGFQQPSASDGFGIVVEGTNMTVENNTVSGNDVGIQVQAGHGPYTANTNTDGNDANLADTYFGRGNSPVGSGTIRYNHLSGNTIGLRTVGLSTDPITASCNWWSDLSGPTNITENPGGTGQPLVLDATSANVIVSPWLVYGTDADPGTEGFQTPTAFSVAAGADTSLADNGYRRLSNAVGCVLDGQTVTLSGTFDWTQANAQAAWANGNDGDTSTVNDNWWIQMPADADNVTLTAASLGSATVQGPGDLVSVDFEGFIGAYDSGTHQGWTFSNLEILDFDLGIGLFHEAGPTTAFNDTLITNNRFLVATDLNATAAPADLSQNIGIHLAFGTNQTVSNNLIQFGGDGVSDSAGSAFAASVGLQSNTSGGSTYDGLQIVNNVLEVLNAQSSDPEVILGLWENAHGHTANITVSGNSFSNSGAGNDPALNLQRAFRLTSHSGASSTVTYNNNTIQGANIGFQWITASNFAAHQPIVMVGNALSDVGTGFLVQSNGKANISQSTLTNTGQTGIGVEVTSGSVVTIGGAAPADNNDISGFDRGIRSAGNTTISNNGATISGNAVGIELTGGTAAITANQIVNNGVGILVSGGDATAHTVTSNNIVLNTTFGVQNTTGTLLDATGNFWGSAAGPRDQTTVPDACGLTLDNPTSPNNEVSECVSYAPPLAVTLSHFAATGMESSVVVEWTTVSEQEVVAFDVLRATAADSAPTRLTAEPIAAQAAGSAEGASYSWQDSSAQVGQSYFYWLEAIAPDGSRTRLGPVSASVQVPTAVTLGSLGAAPTSGQALPLALGVALLGTLGLAALRRRR